MAVGKNKKNQGGLVYSTHNDGHGEGLFDDLNENSETVRPEQQKLIIRLETKQRAGKKATIIAGFKGSDEDFIKLSKDAKKFCGTGGSVVDGEILIQGDNVKKIKEFLQKRGFKTNNI